MKKITLEDVKEQISKENRRRWITKRTCENKPCVILFKSPIYKIEPGEPDLSGRTLNVETPLFQADGIIDGVKYVLCLPTTVVEAIMNVVILNQMTPDDIVDKKIQIEFSNYGVTALLLGKDEQAKQVDSFQDKLKLYLKQKLEQGKIVLPRDTFLTDLILSLKVSYKELQNAVEKLEKEGYIELSDKEVKIIKS